MPEEKRRGNWETGYNSYDGDLYIFCNIRSSGRSGHDYDNRWLDGDRFQWLAKGGTRVGQNQIQWMLIPTGNILLFTRDDNRQPFTFQGYCKVDEYTDTTPVKIVWRVQQTPTVAVRQLDEGEIDYSSENRLSEVMQRQKQSAFRRLVLENFDRRCCISGISESNLLVASHIVPWAHRVDSRLDPANGLLLFVLYDALFDGGYFSLADDLRVISCDANGISEELAKVLSSIKGRQIRDPGKVGIDREYLAYHREVVFLG